MKHTVPIAALACALVATLGPHSAGAQGIGSVPPPPPPASTFVVEDRALPNPTLFRGGAVILAVSYVPAATVALFSDHKGDANLFIPVAGPWIDLGTRSCSGSTVATIDGPMEVGSSQICGSSGIEQFALITDGIVQGIGALSMVSSLFIPQRQLTAWVGASPSRKFTVSPSSFSGRGVGAVAAGRF